MDRCEKTSLIDLAVLFCKVDLPLFVHRDDTERGVRPKPTLFTLTSVIIKVKFVKSAWQKGYTGIRGKFVSFYLLRERARGG